MGVQYLTKEELQRERDNIKGVYQKGSWIVHLERKNHRITKYIKKHYGSGAEILELGTGAGHTLRTFIEAGFRNIRGVDIDDYLIFPELRDFLVLADLNVNPLPVENGSQDVLLAFEIMEHLENAARFAREAARVIKNGGTLFLSVPYGHTIWDKIKFFRSGNLINYHQKNNHITFLTRDVFGKLFFKDFELIETFWSHGWVPPLRPRRWNKLLPPHPLWSTKVCYILKRK